MISKKYYQELLSDTAFKRDYSKTIEDFFNYIVESKIIGAYSQTKDLINKLSQDQFKLFCNWFNPEIIQEDLNKFIQMRGY